MNFEVFARVLFFPLCGYLCGSLSFALWITRIIKGVDVRNSGSLHASATNTFRQAGWLAGCFVLILDMAKGFIPTYLSLHFCPEAWIVPTTAIMVVVGHCWPLFARFRGGMGLATAGGAILSISPLGFLISLGVLIFMVLVIRHAARATVLSGLLVPAVLYLFGFRDISFWVSIGLGLVLIIRFSSDWHRKYRELWLDRN